MKSLINLTVDEFMNLIYKGLVVAALIVATMCAIILKCQLNDAERYIKRLESDFPEYIDTTSRTDEFSNYYNWK